MELTSYLDELPYKEIYLGCAILVTMFHKVPCDQAFVPWLRILVKRLCVLLN
jgi:hypothetical protein